MHRLVGEIARMAAALGDVDAIAFTGGPAYWRLRCGSGRKRASSNHNSAEAAGCATVSISAGSELAP